jgi:6-phosphogluconolactonase
VYFHQVDERWVPAGDPENNARMIRETLVSRAPVPGDHFHCVDTSLSSPEEGARKYEQELREAITGRHGNFPRFDAILLGIGGDGHTASLFPGGAVSSGDAWVIATGAAGDPPVRRVTLSLPAIVAARRLVFVVSGKGKARALSAALSGDPDIPASMVARSSGKVKFLADSDAASVAPRKGGRR